MGTREHCSIYSEHVRNDRTIEICRAYHTADVDNQEHDIVFIYNDQGNYFGVYATMQDLMKTVQEGCGAAPCIFECETEEALDAFITGENRPDRALELRMKG